MTSKNPMLSPVIGIVGRFGLSRMLYRPIAGPGQLEKAIVMHGDGSDIKVDALFNSQYGPYFALVGSRSIVTTTPPLPGSGDFRGYGPLDYDNRYTRDRHARFAGG